MNIPKVLEPLFNKDLKNWDYAIVYCSAHGMVALEPDTKYEIKEDVLMIESKEVDNPMRRQSSEPATVDLVICMDVDFITSVDLLKFPKIIASKKKIIT